MFFFLSRLFACLASPVVYLLAILVIATITKKQHLRKALLISDIILILLFTNNYIYYIAEQAWNDGNIHEIDTTKHYDYAIIPGGMTNYEIDRQRIEYGEAAERIIDCAAFYKRGIIDKIIISGDGASNSTGDARVFLEHLHLVYDIDSTDVIIETAARNTIQNFSNIIDLMGDDLVGKKIVIINSGNFMRRTKLCCRKFGLTCDYYTTDYRLRPRDSWESWIPNFHLLDDWMDLAHEWIGYVVYDVTF